MPTWLKQNRVGAWTKKKEKSDAAQTSLVAWVKNTSLRDPGASRNWHLQCEGSALLAGPTQATCLRPLILSRRPGSGNRLGRWLPSIWRTDISRLKNVFSATAQHQACEKPALGIDNTVFTSTASYQTLEVPSWRSVEVVCSTAASRQRCQSPAPGMGRVICTSTASHQTLEVPSWYSVGVVCSTAARPQRCQSPTPGMDTVICTNKFSCQTCEAPSLRWSMADSSMHGLRPREHQE